MCILDFFFRKDKSAYNNSHRLPSDDSQKVGNQSSPNNASQEEKYLRDGIAREINPDAIHPLHQQQGGLLVPSKSPTGEDLAKRELTLGDGWDFTGFAFPTWKKWSILSSVFLVQISMNYNASAYANAVSGLTEEYGISGFQARLGQMVFLVAYVC